jgi:hypothetical protein
MSAVRVRLAIVVDADVQESPDGSAGHAQHSTELDDRETFCTARRHPPMREVVRGRVAYAQSPAASATVNTSGSSSSELTADVSVAIPIHLRRIGQSVNLGSIGRNDTGGYQRTPMETGDDQRT